VQSEVDQGGLSGRSARARRSRPRRRRSEEAVAAASSAERIWVPSGLDRIALLLFGLTAILSFSAIKLGAGGIPLRVVTLMAAGGALFLSDPRQFLASAARFHRVLLIILAAAVLGTIASVASGTPAPILITQLAEIHLQAAIGVLVAGTLALRMGIKAVMLALLVGFATTAIVALGQWVGLDPAWNLRAIMGDLTNDPPLTRAIYENRERPMGMSFAPVLFALQACLILAMLLLPLLTPTGGGRRFQWWVPISCLIIAILCVATGNRSPLLGIVVFLPIYLALTLPRVSLILLPAFGALVLLAEPIFESAQESGVRAVRTDSSSENRGTLRYFGVRLLADRPTGYGFDFDSIQHADAHTSAVKYEKSPESIRQWALHNYYLMILCKHGLFLLLLIPFIMPRSMRQLRAWWAFVPYIVHIFYHNDGPLQGDFLIFFIIPIAMMLSAEPEAPPRGRRVRARAPEPVPA
jgi:hypothetical protein